MNLFLNKKANLQTIVLIIFGLLIFAIVLRTILKSGGANGLLG